MSKLLTVHITHDPILVLNCLIFSAFRHSQYLLQALLEWGKVWVIAVLFQNYRISYVVLHLQIEKHRVIDRPAGVGAWNKGVCCNLLRDLSDSSWEIQSKACRAQLWVLRRITALCALDFRIYDRSKKNMKDHD